MDYSELNKLISWLMSGAYSASTPAVLLRDICERLVAAGMPLSRVGVFVQTLHPDVFGRSFVWRPGAEVTIAEVTFDAPESPQFRDGPLPILFSTGREVRCRLDENASPSFPRFFESMRGEGATDYVALPLLFTDGSIHVTTWTTDLQGGFRDDHLSALRAVIHPFSLLAEIHAMRRTAAALLDTYVGNRAGERILAGQIRRGHAESMQAAIWLSDLRGFTSLSDRLPAKSIVDILNQYFDCQVPAIRTHGGEILKFMGDGLLEVFPVAKDGKDLGDVCNRVMAASSCARVDVDRMQFQAEGRIERFRFGIALHVGDILFGNIGGLSRLDFTCIGPAVNLAARLEKIASRLRRTLVASASFADACRQDWLDLGEFPVAGSSKAQRIFGLQSETT